ncbi:MAG: glycerate 2-kinase [Thermoanaerobaculia bacterium]|nr:glycerate 2-kinase [Thermoanaerobaculia bacterium]
MLDHLRTIYLRALDACAPERLVRAALTRDMPRHVVAIGKCAGALRDGLDDVDDAFVAVPDGYRLPLKRSQIAIGGHPEITAASFDAGRQMANFVAAHEDILFLISGGGSACVELPLEPWFDERDLIATNARLVASALPIGDINCVRKHLSAIKGGRLAARVKRSVTRVYSDVSTGALADVASGPTMADVTTKADAIAILERLGGCERIVATLRDEACPETVKRIDDSRFALIADNRTLVAKAAEIAASMGFIPVVVEQQIESEIGDAAEDLLARASRLRIGEVLIAGGEPTLVRRGDGKGGRCIELAVRMALAADERRSDFAERRSDSPVRRFSLRKESDWRVRPTFVALLGTSDGLDGNSGVAAVALALPASFDRETAIRELLRSNSLVIAEEIGETIMIPPAGNNLRDLYLLARA